jgi:hypothetical protein
VGYNNDELPMITFKGTSLKEWIAEVGGTEELGVTFGVNIGPFPRAPTDNTIKVIGP